MGTGMVRPGTDGPLKPGDQPGLDCRSGLEEDPQSGSGEGAVVDRTGDGYGGDVLKPGHVPLRVSSVMWEDSEQDRRG